MWQFLTASLKLLYQLFFAFKVLFTAMGPLEFQSPEATLRKIIPIFSVIKVTFVNEP